jgi:hypothetical protein
MGRETAGEAVGHTVRLSRVGGRGAALFVRSAGFSPYFSTARDTG